jgi:anti-sigma-K factor RskA
VKTGNRELLDRLAAEYVLGTLRGRARRRFERWLLSPQVGSLVTAWEKRLMGLEPALESVAPPPKVWSGIERRLDLRKSTRAPAVRWLAIAASVAFFATLGVFAIRGIGPGTPEVVAPALAATQKSFIQADPQTIYWRVEILGDASNPAQQIALHVHVAHDLPVGKSHELWALPEGGAPVSLGLLPASGDVHRVLTAAQRAALSGARNIAVSLEPEGGSPTGTPGEVLHVAALQAASA